MDIHDIYKKDGVYFIVTELVDEQVTGSMPVAEYVLRNYIGSTQVALGIYKVMINRSKQTLKGGSD